VVQDKKKVSACGLTCTAPARIPPSFYSGSLSSPSQRPGRELPLTCTLPALAVINLLGLEAQVIALVQHEATKHFSLHACLSSFWPVPLAK
jgi:hypothetical protein